MHRDRAVGVGLAHADETDHRVGWAALGYGRSCVSLVEQRTAWSRNEWVCGEYLRTRAAAADRGGGGAHLDHGGVRPARPGGGVPAWRCSPDATEGSKGFVVGTTTAIYTIPSLALFSLLLPFTGLTADHGGHRAGAVLADDPGPQRHRGAQGGARRRPRVGARDGLRPGPAAVRGRAAARGPRGDGRAPGRHRLDRRADHGRLDRRLRRARATCCSRPSTASSRPRCSPPACCAWCSRSPSTCWWSGAQWLLTPWTRTRGAVLMLQGVVDWFSDPANWQGEDGVCEPARRARPAHRHRDAGRGRWSGSRSRCGSGTSARAACSR